MAGSPTHYFLLNLTHISSFWLMRTIHNAYLNQRLKAKVSNPFIYFQKIFNQEPHIDYKSKLEWLCKSKSFQWTLIISIRAASDKCQNRVKIVKSTAKPENSSLYSEIIHGRPVIDVYLTSLYTEGSRGNAEHNCRNLVHLIYRSF